LVDDSPFEFESTPVVWSEFQFNPNFAVMPVEPVLKVEA
jgi:hypothetical protein